MFSRSRASVGASASGGAAGLGGAGAGPGGATAGSVLDDADIDWTLRGGAAAIRQETVATYCDHPPYLDQNALGSETRELIEDGVASFIRCCPVERGCLSRPLGRTSKVVGGDRCDGICGGRPGADQPRSRHISAPRWIGDTVRSLVRGLWAEQPTPAEECPRLAESPATQLHIRTQVPPHQRRQQLARKPSYTGLAEPDRVVRMEPMVDAVLDDRGAGACSGLRGPRSPLDRCRLLRRGRPRRADKRLPLWRAGT